MPDTAGIVRSTRTVFEGRVFRVGVDRVLLPHGREVDLEIVHHPPSVVLLPLQDAEHVWMVRQYRHAIGQWIWELPAGSLDPGESVEEAAARECREEVGLQPGVIQRLASLYPTPGYCDELMMFLRLSDLARPGDQSAVAIDEDEAIEVGLFSIAEARSMVARGEIQDMKTVVGLSLL